MGELPDLDDAERAREEPEFCRTGRLADVFVRAVEADMVRFAGGNIC